MALERCWQSESPQATEALGQALGECVPAGTVITLDGELGAGKTCFTRGLARGLGIVEQVSSPTYALMHSYQGPHASLLHFDAWMEDRERALLAEGAEEFLLSSAVVAIEWAQRVADFLPPTRLAFSFALLSEQQRTIRAQVLGEGDQAQRLELCLRGLRSPVGITETIP